MPFISVWVFFSLVLAALIHNYGEEFLTLFFGVNLCMILGVLIYLIYTKIYRHEYRNLYQYLNKYIKS